MQNAKPFFELQFAQYGVEMKYRTKYTLQSNIGQSNVSRGINYESLRIA